MLARLTKAASRPDRAGNLRASALTAEALVAKAEREAGRKFSDPAILQPLQILLSAYEEEAGLSLFGRFAVKWDIARFLGNLLRLEQEEEQSPGILREEIVAPVFITGLPRSGTTFLHSLLSQDPDNRAPLSWQTIYPYPLRQDLLRDRRAARVERQLRMFKYMSPGVGDLHPLAADTPQECTEITAHVFQSLRFDTTHYVPSYQQWLIEAGHQEAFRFHKRFLQHLQHQLGHGQWVLKSPDHLFTMAAVKTVYSDVRFVFVHRDPLSVLPSVAKLTALLRAPFTRRLNRGQIGRQVSERWVEGAELIARESATDSRITHVHYRTLVEQPVETVASLYDRFGRPFTPWARKRLEDYIEKRPRGGYGVNKYRFEEFGLDAGRLREQFQPYMAAFGVEHEYRHSATNF